MDVQSRHHAPGQPQPLIVKGSTEPGCKGAPPPDTNSPSVTCPELLAHTLLPPVLQEQPPATGPAESEPGSGRLQQLRLPQCSGNSLFPAPCLVLHSQWRGIHTRAQLVPRWSSGCPWDMAPTRGQHPAGGLQPEQGHLPLESQYQREVPCLGDGQSRGRMAGESDTLL